ncbi:hypothetical protein PR048_004815 [Dryococelus australis]|uniref:Uncharacterized protein n=1 Tax=Dryococelus australis TaxID=614101 RepID=A0ABQ9I6I6_9NEOP|nr:hypothetical protein PR048_004815 [Dryococelus australis]
METRNLVEDTGTHTSVEGGSVVGKSWVSLWSSVGQKGIGIVHPSLCTWPTAGLFDGQEHPSWFPATGLIVCEAMNQSPLLLVFICSSRFVKMFVSEGNLRLKRGGACPATQEVQAGNPQDVQVGPSMESVISHIRDSGRVKASLRDAAGHKQCGGGKGMGLATKKEGKRVQMFSTEVNGCDLGAGREQCVSNAPRREVFKIVIASKRGDKKCSALQRPNKPTPVLEGYATPAPRRMLIMSFSSSRVQPSLLRLSFLSRACGRTRTPTAAWEGRTLSSWQLGKFTSTPALQLEQDSSTPVTTQETGPEAIGIYLEGHAAASGFSVHPQLLLHIRLDTLTATAAERYTAFNSMHHKHGGLWSRQRRHERRPIGRQHTTDNLIVNSNPTELLPSEPEHLFLCYDTIIPPTHESPLKLWLDWCPPDDDQEDTPPKQLETELPTCTPDHPVPPHQALRPILVLLS